MAKCEVNHTTEMRAKTFKQSWHISVAVIFVALILQWLISEKDDMIWLRRPSFVTYMNQKLNQNAFYGMCYNGQSLLDPRANYCEEVHSSLVKKILSYLRIPFSKSRSEKESFLVLNETLSIIMPFHNQGYMTCQSLYELAQDSQHFRAEFILVSDASNRRDLEKVNGCITRMSKKFSIEYDILENELSIGYGPSCNVGAKRAKGMMLLFANNDMFVGNGAVHALVHTLLEYPEAGIVGPLFLGDDMIIQELGGVIYQDASAANAYRHHDGIPKPLFMTHEVDYVSAACLLIRKIDFDALGGFDKAYGRGYYEDTDLAMAIRKLGKKVILQPFASVFHQEGGTFGNDTTEKQMLMTKNRMVFFSKWYRELKVFSRPDSLPMKSRERYMVNQVLWADQYFITPSHDSGSQRTHQILKYLRAIGFQVSFLPMTTVAAEEIMPSIARMRFDGIRILTDKKTAFCDEQTDECIFSIIFISRPFTFRDIRNDLDECCINIPRVYDTVDLHFLREARQFVETQKIDKRFSTDKLVDLLACGKNKSRIEVESIVSMISCLDNHGWPNTTAAVINKVRWLHSLMVQELNGIRDSDITLVVSEEEKNVLTKMGIQASKLKILSNIYPDVDFDNAFQNVLPGDQPRKNDAIFVGNFQHIPNIGAVKSLINITHVVSQIYPDFKMHIVGSHALPDHLSNRIKSIKNIIFHGWLSDKDLGKLYEEVICSFVPLATGAGVKGKVASSYLHGVPVVGSGIATEGMGLQEGHDFLLAENAEEYLKAYSFLRSNQSYRENLTLHGIQVIKDRFSFSTAAKNLSHIIKKLGYFIPDVL